MITKPQLKEKGYSGIEKYFDFILDSQTKGEDTKELIKAMSQRQKNHFACYLDSTECKYHHTHIQSAKDILFSL